jgi:predicted RNA-binding Zn-ribbon protein involved in translation (DUF1610 family)
MGTWNAYTCGSCGHEPGTLREGGGDLCGRMVALCGDCDRLVSIVVSVADAPDEDGDTPALAELRASIGRCPLCGGTHLGRPSQGGRVVKRLRCPRCSERLLQTAGGHWA